MPKRNWTPTRAMRGFRSTDLGFNMSDKVRRAIANAYIDGMKDLADDLQERVPGSETHKRSEALTTRALIAVAQSRLRADLTRRGLRR